MMKILLVVVIVLFVASAVNADFQLDSLRQARVQVYLLLNIDTSGAGGLATLMVDRYVNCGINRVNEDLLAYRRDSLIPTVKSQRTYDLDSMLRVVKIDRVDDNSIEGLKPLSIKETDGVFDIVDLTDEDKPEYYTVWGKSIRFYPTPNIADDTMLVHYVCVIPEDSLRLVPSQYRLGIVFYAAYLSALQLSMPDAEKFLNIYDRFVGKKKAEVE